MASRHFDAVNALTKRLIIIEGTIQLKGTGAPVIVNGSGFTVSRTATGLYTVQFQDNYSAVQFAAAEMVQATPANTASIVLLNNSSTVPGAQMNLLIGTFATPQTAVDITQTSTDGLTFVTMLRNSSIPS